MKRSTLLVWCLLSACGSKTLETVERPAAGGAGAGVGGSGGVEPGGSGAVAIAGSSLGGALSGGAFGGSETLGAGPLGGAGTAEGGAADGHCADAGDCPATNNFCSYATCTQGSCGVAFSASGTLVERDSPADCLDTVCDGKGGEARVVDGDNAPKASDACTVSSCSPGGAVVTMPAKTGAACAAGVRTLCDGAGNCVECLTDDDCDVGATCQQSACISHTCGDGFKDGSETDIDCGGDCSLCELTKDCALDADCESGSCDALPPHRCVPEHCADHHKNQDETDDDCGGSCGQCHDGWVCAVDADCKSGFCDPPRGPRCLSAQCLDGEQNGTETDVDCGGGICDGCAVGEKCVGSYDCDSQACNPVIHQCVADHCGDNAWDGDETYTDCGGATCRRCKAGELCETAADCEPGLSCFPGNPHFCQ